MASFRFVRLCSSSAQYKRSDKQYDEYDEQDFGYAGHRGCNPEESEDACRYSEQKEQ
jgi:hypothetical protein